MRAFSVNRDGTLRQLSASDLVRLGAADADGDRIHIYPPFGLDLEFFQDEDTDEIFIEAIVPEDLHVGEEHIKDMIVAWAASLDVNVTIDNVEVFVGQSTALPPPEEAGLGAEIEQELKEDFLGEEEEILMGPGMDAPSTPTPQKQQEQAPRTPSSTPTSAPSVSAPAKQQGADV